MLNDRTAPLTGSAAGTLKIEWYDASDREICHRTSEPWNASLPSLRWSAFSVRKAVPPATAVKVRFVVHLDDGDNGGGSILVDDACVTED